MQDKPLRKQRAGAHRRSLAASPCVSIGILPRHRALMRDVVVGHYARAIARAQRQYSPTFQRGH